MARLPKTDLLCCALSKGRVILAEACAGARGGWDNLVDQDGRTPRDITPGAVVAPPPAWVDLQPYTIPAAANPHFIAKGICALLEVIVACVHVHHSGMSCLAGFETAIK